MRSKRETGLTLIEVMIAVSLVGLLSVGMLTAIRIGLGAMGRANEHLMDNRRVANTRKVLEAEIAGFVPVTAIYRPEQEERTQSMMFFEGEPQSMRFVSSYSLGEAWRGDPQILEFQVIPGEKNFGVRLIVNEWRYTGPRSAGIFCLGHVADPTTGAQLSRFRPIEAGPHSFVLADKLRYCRFSYLERMPQPKWQTWHNSWILPRWPNGVRIEMEPLEEKSGRLSLGTLVAPLRVNRSPDYGFSD